ncbi:MAG: hypothetical protein KatS3mg090_0192 [Patescibacteria group bacterium]|nr:MAG: hypothetical protein KatS3mg090_0192 [Patescibacteria group bacterium]
MKIFEFLSRIKNRVSYQTLFFYLTLTAGIFLRLYNIDKTLTFLGDQGRDAIIIKRMITFQDFTFVGPPSSIGQIRLGPFYYYFIAPFLALFNFNPVGLGVAVAFYSVVLSILILYFFKGLVKDEVRFILFGFLMLSPILIEFSRFSWNPNLLPYTSLLTTIFFSKALQTKKTREQIRYLVLFSFFLSISLQLHYSVLFILPVYAVFFILFLIKTDNKLKKFTAVLAPAIILFLPLMLFELKHKFINIKLLLQFLNEDKTTNLNYSSALFNFTNTLVASSLTTYKSNLLNLGIVSIALTAGIIIKQMVYTISSLNILLTALIFTLMRFESLPHYLFAIIAGFYLLITLLITQFKDKKVVFLFCIALILLWANNYNFVFYKPKTTQIQTARKYADLIFNDIKTDSFQIIGVPFTESTATQRYFIELKGKTPLEENSAEIPKELFVFCYRDCDNILGNDLWQIAVIKNKSIAKTWKIDNIKVFKIINEDKYKQEN